MKYYYTDLCKLLDSTDLDYFMGFEIRPPSSDHDGGIWVKEISHTSRRLCTPRELKSWCDPYAYQLRQPIVSFPCTDEQIGFFLHVTGQDDFLIDDGSPLSNCIKQIRADIDKAIGISLPITKTVGLTKEEKFKALREQAAEFDCYMVKLREYVSTIGTQEQTTAEVVGKSDMPLTAQEYVLSLRAINETNEVIASLIRKNYPGMIAHEGMRLIDSERVEQWESDNNNPNKVASGRPKNWFTYLVKKGDKNLDPRAIVTPAQ